MTDTLHCDCTTGGDGSLTGGLTGRLTGPVPPVRDYWPGHDMSPRTDFISARHRVATLWKI